MTKTGLSEFAGISKTDCPIDCCLDNCVITGKPFCGHPRKGALSPQDMMNPQVLRRRNEATRQLAIAQADFDAERRERV